MINGPQEEMKYHCGANSVLKIIFFEILKPVPSLPLPPLKGISECGFYSDTSTTEISRSLSNEIEMSS